MMVVVVVTIGFIGDLRFVLRFVLRGFRDSS